MLNNINTFLSYLNKFITGISMIILTGIVLITFIQVIFRYFFHNALGWGDEFSRFLLIWLSFLGFSIAVWHNAHLNIDFFVKRVPSFLKKFLNIIIHISIILFLGLAFIYSFKVVEISHNSSLVSIPLTWGDAFVSFPIGIGISLLYYVNSILQKERTD